MLATFANSARRTAITTSFYADRRCERTAINYASTPRVRSIAAMIAARSDSESITAYS
jgi:hypothetical protein